MHHAHPAAPAAGRHPRPTAHSSSLQRLLQPANAPEIPRLDNSPCQAPGPSAIRLVRRRLRRHRLGASQPTHVCSVSHRIFQNPAHQPTSPHEIRERANDPHPGQPCSGPACPTTALLAPPSNSSCRRAGAPQRTARGLRRLSHLPAAPATRNERRKTWPRLGLAPVSPTASTSPQPLLPEPARPSARFRLSHDARLTRLRITRCASPSFATQQIWLGAARCRRPFRFCD